MKNLTNMHYEFVNVNIHVNSWTLILRSIAAEQQLMATL